MCFLNLRIIYSIFYIGDTMGFEKIYYAKVEFWYKDGFALDFVNACMSNNIKLENVKIVDGIFVARCAPQDYLSLKRIARKTGGKIKIKSRKGLEFPLYHLITRKGIMAGFLLGVMLINYLCGFVWNIEIVGNNRLKTSQIKEFLVSQGFYEGVYWKSIDKNFVEDMMMSSFEDVAWVQINRNGTSANVELREATKKPKLATNPTTNLKAKKDGIIVSAMVYDGWQVINEGDSVVAGDILVSGVYENKDKKLNLYAHASGKFLAQVVEDFDLTINRQQSYKIVTKEKNYNAISFFGINVPLYIGKIPSKNVTVLESANYIKLNHKKLPIGIVSKNASFYEKAEKTLSDKELYSLTKSEIEKVLSQKYKNGQIVSKSIDISLTNNSAVAKGSITIIEDIGVEKVIIKG